MKLNLYSKMGIGDWGLGIGGWGLGEMDNDQSLLLINNFFK